MIIILSVQSLIIRVHFLQEFVGARLEAANEPVSSGIQNGLTYCHVGHGAGYNDCAYDRGENGKKDRPLFLFSTPRHVRKNFGAELEYRRRGALFDLGGGAGNV
jgi:hypothetical protein